MFLLTTFLQVHFWWFSPLKLHPCARNPQAAFKWKWNSSESSVISLLRRPWWGELWHAWGGSHTCAVFHMRARTPNGFACSIISTQVASVLFSVSVSDETSCLSPAWTTTRFRGPFKASPRWAEDSKCSLIVWGGQNGTAGLELIFLHQKKPFSFPKQSVWSSKNPPTRAVCHRENNFAQLKISLCFRSNFYLVSSSSRTERKLTPVSYKHWRINIPLHITL